MTFEQVLQEAIQKQKERDAGERRLVGENGHLLLSLRDSQSIRNHIRAILQASGESAMEPDCE